MNTWTIILGAGLLILLCVAISVMAANYTYKLTHPKKEWVVLILVSTALPIILIIDGAAALWPAKCPAWYPSGQFTCERGRIKIGGSTALQPLLETAAKNYQNACPGANATIDLLNSDPTAANRVTGSRQGLDLLTQGDLDIASSDIFMDSVKDAQTVAHFRNYEVAVVIYVVIVHKSGPDMPMPVNLSVSDLQKIFNGQRDHPLTWDQFGGPPNLNIVPFIRNADSGTQRTFEDFVLHSGVNIPPEQRKETPEEIIKAVADTEGAIGYVSLYDWLSNNDPTKIQALFIDGMQPGEENVTNNRYPFWNIEHLYMGNDQPSKLAEDFINSLWSANGQKAIRNNGYVTIGAMQSEALDTRCP